MNKTSAKVGKKKNKKPYLFIPIETKVRELHGKLLLSLVAAEKGFNVILGGQHAIRDKLHTFPPGIYLDKSVSARKIKWFPKFRRLGNIIAALDEEGLIIHEKDYLKARFSSESFNQTALFFAWGAIQKNIIVNKHLEFKKKVILTGNPRFDMLRPELRGFYSKPVEALQKKYDKFILINTSFGIANHFSGQKVMTNLFKTGTKLKESFIDAWYDFNHQAFSAFIEMLPVLCSSFPDYTIIIRPHPSENFSTWKKFAIDLPTVKVIHEGNVIEWILAAQAVIHSNCTTGVESFLLNIPVIAYRPVVSDKYEAYLPNALSQNVYHLTELITKLNLILKNNYKNVYPGINNEPIKIAKRYITGIDGPWASERIVKKLSSLNPHSLSSATSCTSQLSRIWMKSLLTTKDTVKRYLLHKRFGIGYQKQKFPGIKIDEVVNSTIKMQNISHRFVNTKVVQIGDSCFKITNR